MCPAGCQSGGLLPEGRWRFSSILSPPHGGFALDLSCPSEHVIFWVWAYNSKGSASVFRHMILSHVLNIEQWGSSPVGDPFPPTAQAKRG